MFCKQSFGRKVFIIINYTFLIVVAALCIFPIIHILAVSLSSEVPVNAGAVKIWPIGLTMSSYKYVLNDVKFYNAFLISMERTILGLVISMVLTVLSAYPLSKSQKVFKARGFYIWFFLITILFSGGLIPTYLAVRYTGLIDTIWALILPISVPVFNIIILQNFFKELPDEISEAAFIDGAGHWTVLFKIMIPLSKPAIATLILFTTVTQWNSWFDGMIYMNSAEHYPLQTYLQTIIVQTDLKLVSNIDDLTANVTAASSKAAEIFIAMIPILLVYPFIQPYFTKGIIMGSVKG